MKLLHLSDIHVNPDPILGSDPEQGLNAALAHIAEFHGDADRLVITGDLVHHGDEASYRRLRVLLANAGFSIDPRDERSPRLLIGNHDDRPRFLKVFPEVSTDPHGFVQSVDPTPIGWFVYLDTQLSGTHSGHFCPLRFAWLRATLERARDVQESVWLFMHHNPLPVGVACSDEIGLVQSEAFCALLTEYRDVVRHVFFGHCHFTLSGSVSGIPFSAPRSTNHPCWPEFQGDASRMAYGPLEPNYNLCILDDRGVVIHSIDFARQTQIEYLETDDSGWVDDGSQPAQTPLDEVELEVL